MASTSIRIGIICPLAGERAAFQEWLKLSGYEPVSIANIESVSRDMATRPIEALIADVALVTAADLPRIVRMLGPNRPLILVGNPTDAIEDVPRDATWMNRPVSRESFQLSVALALAEGRPARRSPRKVVPRLLSTIDGVASKLVDISSEGVRLEIPGASPATLPPYFVLKVPSFGVAAKVKRVWVATPGPNHLWCGGIIERQAEKGSKTPWQSFVQTAPLTKKTRNQMIVQVD
jgi:hypothetical protein